MPLDIIRYQNTVNKLLKQENFDIAHVEEPYVGGSIDHKRKITTIHDTSYGEIKVMLNQLSFQDMKRMLFFFSLGPYEEWKCIASSNAIVVPASHIMDEVSRIYHANKKRIKIIPNGVEIPQFVDKDGAKKVLNLSPSRVLIFTASQHIVRKRIDVLIDAIRLLIRSNVDGFDVIIAGHGPLTPWLSEMIRKYDLTKVITLVGWVSEDKLKLFYEAADIFVLTAEYEAGPISLLEAGSYGDCIVSSNIEGFPRLMVQGVDGLLYKIGDAPALASSIRKVIENLTLQRQLSQSGREFAMRFRWENVARDTKQLYECML